MDKKQTEKLIFQIFKLCDETVWIEAFEKILKKFGLDIYPIYFGVKDKKEFMRTRKALYDKWFSDSEMQKKRPQGRLK